MAKAKSRPLFAWFFLIGLWFMAVTTVATDWLTAEEASQYLTCGLRSFRRHLAAGQIPYTRLPGARKLLFNRLDLDRLLEAGRVDPSERVRGGGAR